MANRNPSIHAHIVAASASATFEREALQYADSSEPILLLGETGSGKNRLAKRIHEQSPHNKGKFISVSLAALDDNIASLELFGSVKGAFTDAKDTMGAFDAANGGTIFLDEIGDISIPLQLKLLQILNDRTFSRVGESKKAVESTARVICATNRNLKAAVREGTFRKDLYYRVAVFSIQLPPLRHRREDVVRLGREFFCQSLPEGCRARSDELAGLLGNRFATYDWPGNVRELLTAVKLSIMAIAHGVQPAAAMDVTFTKVHDLSVDDGPSDTFDEAGISFCTNCINSLDQTQPRCMEALNAKFALWIEGALRRVSSNKLPGTLSGFGRMFGDTALASGQFKARGLASKQKPSPLIIALNNCAQDTTCGLPPKVRDAFLNGGGNGGVR